MGTLAVFPTTPETFTRLRAVADTGPFARFDAAKKGLLSAGNDWPAMLGYAQTLSESPRWTDTELARHTRQAHALHLRNVAETPAGVALCDLDDPYAMPEILDRDQAAELLGHGFVDNMESME